MNHSILRAGTAVADITPPLEVGLLTSSVEGRYDPFTSVRLPLKTRVLALITVDTTVVLVSLDLLGLSDTATGGWQAFKQGLSDEIPPEHIIITCTHTHNAPESVALSALYLTPVYRTWLHEVQQKIHSAIRIALSDAKECNVSISCGVLEGYSLQRRIPTPTGIVMSDSMQPIAPELMLREPADRRVHTLRFTGEQGIIATVVHAVCHPVHEMCLPHVSPDFPGELCNALEAAGDHGMVLFLNGAAGDINPPTVSEGPAAAKQHGAALAAVVQQEAQNKLLKPELLFAHDEISFGIRTTAVTNKEDARARINAIVIGQLAIVFLPGEPFTTTALEIEKASPFPYTLVAAYAENTIGYMPDIKGFAEGGYEAGPGKWSFLETGAAAKLQATSLHLLNQLKSNP
ncbi:hypothetical protein PV783_22850 [Chitinophaga sp. CC14]|uniref:hypothetical protein n=1 Tax=Chitinophaga sp. CC14 TaxID=3029199 RepID=UPI003B79F459